jgi:hypothetical protein
MTLGFNFMATKSDSGVWMTDDSQIISIARSITEQVMALAKLDGSDFRLRDLLIEEISETVNNAIDSAVDQSIYKRAMDSMAAQMIHPKMTGLEMAKMQLKGEAPK